MPDPIKNPAVSRRKFLRESVTGAAATAAMAATGTAAAQTPASTTSAIRVPTEFGSLATVKGREYQFPMTGAEVFARACKDEGVAALFCCPGNYTVIHAIASAGIPAFGGRHEGSMAHAADAFIRSTGELAIASGTEGPGFTDMICAIACANAARTPLLVVASNMSMGQEDTEAGIQLGYQQPTTEGSEEVRQAPHQPPPRARVHRIRFPAAEERRAEAGAPGLSPRKSHRPSSRTRQSSSSSSTRRTIAPIRARRPSSKDIAKAIDMIRAAQRPIDRVEQRRLLPEGVGRTEAVRREGADSRRRIGRDEGAVL